MPRLLPVAMLLVCARTALAQSPPPAGKPDAPPTIQDNSFLMEEAYNQEEGVVQHINTFQRMRGGDWVATFTQEYPVPRQAHQLSYTIPYERPGQAGVGVSPHAVIGDGALAAEGAAADGVIGIAQHQSTRQRRLPSSRAKPLM